MARSSCHSEPSLGRARLHVREDREVDASLRVDWVAMSSWYDAWADRYEDWSPSFTADVPFYIGLARDADGPLVELAVGTGRVAIPVAQATGRRVIGIDSSPAMLAQARARAVEE